MARNIKKVKYSMFPHLLWTFDARTADNSKRLGTFGAAVVSASYLGQVVSSKYQTNITINAEWYSYSGSVYHPHPSGENNFGNILGFSFFEEL